MTDVVVSVRYAWAVVGGVELDELVRLRFPKVSETPGLYKFQYERDGNTHAYIGETDRLRRRLQHYRTPGPSQTTNIRLNKLLLEVLALGIPVSVSVATAPMYIQVDGVELEVDLVRKSERVLAEHAAIYAARLEGMVVLNL